MLKRIILAIIGIIFINFSYSQSFDIRFQLESINCQTRIACYNVQLKSSNSVAWNLAGQNYRIFYNSKLASYQSGSSVLPIPTYSGFELVQDLQHQNADAINGALGFESDLGFLNYYIDLNNLNSGAISIGGNWITTSKLCFLVDPSVINGTSNCLELIWARSNLTSEYATAFVEVSKWVSGNNTQSISGSNYDDLDANDGDGACFDTSCGQGTPAIEVRDITVSENTGFASVQVCLSSASTQIITGQFATSNGTAISGIDYSPINVNFAINPGAICTIINVPITDDLLAEPSETIITNISSINNANIGDGSGIIQISDNDSNTQPQLTISDISVNENTGYAILQICLGSASTQQVSGSIVTQDITAIQGFDYAAINAVFSIAPGSLCTTVQIPIFDDNMSESNEAFVVLISNVLNATVIGGSANITILDNDNIVVQNEFDIRFQLATVDCNTRTACYNVQLRSNDGMARNLAGQNYRLYYNNAVASYLSGSSSLPNPEFSNYTLVQNFQHQNADIVNGPLNFESDLGFLNYYMDLNDPNTSSIQIDGNWKTTSQLCFLIDPNVLNTNSSCLEIVWARNGLTNSYATAFVEVAEWKGPNNLIEMKGMLHDDLTPADGDASCFDQSCPPPPSVSVGDITINEGAGTANVQVCLSTLSSLNVSGSFITTNGTAISPDDFVQINSTFNIPAGNLCTVITVPIIDDALIELSEFINVTISNISNATIGDGKGIITIMDNDTSTYAKFFDIRFKLKSLDCSDGTACYEVQLRSSNGAKWYLAGQNYRIFYNSAIASYKFGRSVLATPKYSNYVLVQDLQHQNADAINGALDFEADLGLLNYYIDLNDQANGGILLDGNWLTTSELCFKITSEALSINGECVELIWARDGLTNPYATAYVEIAKWTNPLLTEAANPVIYDDLNSLDGPSSCLFNTCSGMAIGDRVWRDINGDGLQDLGEPGQVNVHVYLYDCLTGNLVAKDTTDSNGIYNFDKINKVGDYFIRYDFSPSGLTNYAFTYSNKGLDYSRDSDANASGITSCFHVELGQKVDSIDVGLVELASFGDFVWHDRDVDGQQEFGEEGVQGVTVVLYDKTTNLPVRSAITNNNGGYLFDRLMPQQYYAKYTYPSGWNPTIPNIGSDITDSDVDGTNGSQTSATTFLSPGEVDRTWDYGLYKCSCISGDVWYDLNKDGIYQSLENGINGLNVYLVDSLTGQVVAKTVSGTKPGTPSDDGYYSFCNCLKPGIYYIRYDRPGELAASAPFQGTDRTKDSHLTHAFGPNTSEKITLNSGSVIENFNAGFQGKAMVGNFVWLDENQNGLQDTGEKPIQDIAVAAYNSNNVKVSEAVTDQNGVYYLDGIAEGSYYFKFSIPAQYAFTRSKIGTDDIDSDVSGTFGTGTTRMIRLNIGDRLPTIDAGLILGLLPLEWLTFTAEYNGSFTELNWSTGVEVNNSHFEIERKYESEKVFKKIGTVHASANATAALHEYGYDDFEVNESGVYYYRIKQVDRDDKFTYSKVIAIKKAKSSDFSVNIYPNPVENLLRVEMKMGDEGLLSVDVYDSNGKQVLSNPFGGFRKAGTYFDNLNVELLVSGNYMLRLQTPQGVVHKKFIVAR